MWTVGGGGGGGIRNVGCGEIRNVDWGGGGGGG